MEDDANEEFEFEMNPKPKQKLIKEERIAPTTPSKSTDMTTLDKRQRSLIDIYKNEPKVSVQVAPSYAKYFGRVMHVSINGISVGVRCDGRPTKLPESFATEVLRRMRKMDDYELRLSRMANVEQNYETSPGQLNFFG